MIIKTSKVQIDSFTKTLTKAKRAAMGDSNDREIGLLWELAEQAAKVLGVDISKIDAAVYEAYLKAEEAEAKSAAEWIKRYG